MFETIFADFGIVGVIGLVAGGAAVWALAHFSAEAGTTVNVLWGLVNYTKSKPKNRELRNLGYAVEAKGNSNSTSFFDGDPTTPEYQAGKQLRVIEDEANSNEGRDYIVFDWNWIKGADKALEHYTSSQKAKEFSKLLEGKWALVEGKVKDLENAIRPIIYLDNHLILMLDKDIETPDLHQGDRVQAHGKPNPLHRSILEADSIERLPATKHP